VCAISLMAWTMTANAATRPVSIGLNANWEHFLARSANTRLRAPWTPRLHGNHLRARHGIVSRAGDYVAGAT
jgi:hypothetical protein